MMVAAVVAALDHRRPAELAAPDDQRVLEHPALLQVLDQRGAGLVGLLQFFFRSFTRLPCWSHDSWKICDEPDAPLEQPAGQQAGIGERRLARLGAVHLEDVPRLVGDLHQRRALGLHAEGHLEGVDPRGDLGVAGGVELHLVQLADSIEAVALEFASTPRGVGEIQHRVAAGAELDALVDGRQEAAAPVGVAAAGLLLPGAEDDEAWEFLRLAAQSVKRPTPPWSAGRRAGSRCSS